MTAIKGQPYVLNRTFEPKDESELTPNWPGTIARLNDPARNLHLVPRGTFTMWPPTGTAYLQTTFKEGIQEGPFLEWYGPGRPLQKGNLINGMPNGAWIHYYKEGTPLYTGTYTAWSQAQLQGYWARDAVQPQKHVLTERAYEDAATNCEREGTSLPPYNIFCNGTQKDGVFTFFRRNGSPWAQIEFSREVPAGTWKVWKENDGKVPLLRITWGEDKMTEIIVTDADGRQRPATIWYRDTAPNHSAELAGAEVGIQAAPDTHNVEFATGVVEAPPQKLLEVYTYVEKFPTFRGDVNKWINDNMRYPPAAKAAGIDGRVVVKFKVLANGRVVNTVVEKGVSPELDAEALRLINAMPAWEPGQQNGKPVSVYFRVPVKFRLP